MTSVSDGGDIAIIGMACRFPGDAKSPREFYEMLLRKRTGWSNVPKDRFNVDAFWHPSYDRHGTVVCKGGHFLQEDVGLFDAPFFSMTQGEANAMDPQQRLLLEITYEALENAGLPLSKVAGSDTACFVGGFTREYNDIVSSELAKTPLYATTGNGITMMSNRLSWFYDFRGPSVSLDTACSSSLVALHLACQAIKASSNTSRQAVVGGVNLILIPDQMTTMNPLHFLSPQSQCYSFDDRANGYTRGEGAGILVLKHIDDAIRDGDCVRAVIRGTGVNSDGKTPGITLPSADAQAALIRSTYSKAGLDTSATGYFESHGTGTAAGDPLEFSAIAATFDRASKQSSPPLYIGGVKPNIGHLEAGAGLAGIIKTILTLEAGVIPPNVNFENPNPRIQLNKFNFAIPTESILWPTQGLRRASVNSFGYGGTNSHCILDDAYSYLNSRGLAKNFHGSNDGLLTPSSDSSDSALGMEGNTATDIASFPKGRLHSQQLFVLSAPEQSALSRLGNVIASYVDDVSDSESSSNATFENIAFTMCNRRSTFQWRTSVVAQGTEDLKAQLRSLPKPTRATKTSDIMFCFTGQGAQWFAMGRELLAYEVYQKSVMAADHYLKSIGAAWSALEELNKSQESSRISKPQFSQPLCIILQTALVDLLRHWKIIPSVVVGHSSGEIAAAYALGVLSAEDSWKIAYHRGRLAAELQTVAPHLDGTMLAVGLSASDIEPYIQKLGPLERKELTIACFNSPVNSTVSGDRKALESLEVLLKADSVFTRRLAVENAYHSAHMNFLAQDYLKSINNIKTLEALPGMLMVSSVTGRKIQAADLGAAYWVMNMVSPVQFLKAIEAVFTMSKGERRKRGATIETIIEVGAHAALQSPIKQILTSLKKVGDVAYATAIRRGQAADSTVLQLAGFLWSKGIDVELDCANNTSQIPKKRIPLSDMPKYPWNHTTRYWHECSPSKTNRFRSHPRTDLLGYPIKEFTMLQPTWKNVLYLSELPWISDHKVRGNDVFPASGMVCAALEAARQIADESRVIQSVDFQDIKIGRALIIPPSDPGVDVFTRLTPRRGSSTTILSSTSSWYEFTFSSLDSSTGGHVEHGSGYVRIKYLSESHGTFHEDEQALKTAAYQQHYLETASNSIEEVSKMKHYQDAAQMGFEYGPTFQGLVSARIGHGHASFTINITDTQAIMPAQFEYEHLLHPSTLDAVIQSASQAMRVRKGIVTESMVPTGFESLSVSARMPKGAGAQLIGFAEAQKIGYRDHVADIVISDPLWRETMIEIHRLGFTGLGDNTDQLIDDEEAVAVRKLCSQNIWRADVDLLDEQTGQPQLLCGQNVETPEELTAWGTMATKATAIFIKRALASLTSDTEERLTAHLKLYVRWMRERHSAALAKKLDHQNGEDWLKLSFEEENEFIATFTKINPEDAPLIQAIGLNLPAILQGTAQPLSIMLENDMLTNIYAKGHALKSGLSMFRDWFALQGHKKPDMRILEVGAGTGSITLPVLEVLGGKGGKTPHFGSYCFTDISPGWFEKAKELFKEWHSRMTFKTLDIENEPLAQGFEPESFDIITASNVLHATKRIDVTLAHCFKLLKPEGKIVIGELTCRQDDIGLAFGTLPGWWLSEDGRMGGPLMTQSEWHGCLQNSGFTGIESTVAARDTLGNAKLSMMVSRKPAMQTTVIQRISVIRSTTPDAVGKAFEAALIEDFKSNGTLTESLTLEEVALRAKEGSMSAPGHSIISLLEIDEPLFARCSKENFQDLRTVILNSADLLWVTCQASADGTCHPDSCAISGLLRVAKSENERLRLRELHLQKRDAVSAKSGAKTIRRVVQSASSITIDTMDQCENETVEAKNVLTIPRLQDEEQLNRTIQHVALPPQPVLQPLLQPDRPLSLTIGKVGLLDKLCFVDNNLLVAPLQSDEVEIEVQTCALNQNDLMVALGQKSDLVLGLDAAGIVKKLGKQVTRLRIGDRVAFVKRGSMATHAHVKEILAQRLPDGMSLEEGATVPLIFMAAYHSLIETAHLSAGERVLIHSAAGGLGQAMIQICQHLGAEVFVTVGNIEKRDLLRRAYGIPESHVFYSGDLDFADGIKRTTTGHGVDVVVNTQTGQALEATWSCMAQFGRLVELGERGILANNGLELKHSAANVSFSRVNIQHICEFAPAKAAVLLERIFALLHFGAIKTVQPIAAFDYADVESAFRSMQNGLHTGKIVLKVSDQSMVPALPHHVHPLQLHPDATYVLVGGLGGLGRGLATYFADHGAKHLAFFSRSEEMHPAAAETIAKLRRQRVCANVFVCDITVPETLERAIAKIESEMPPIKGVIQGAMVLQDGLFETMSHESWMQATRPKIEGSWNLHELMPHTLDFFILLSSLAGIVGNRGQANYCAGNTYQDALAHYRRSLGLPAQVIDLGAISGLGWFEENKEQLQFADTMQNLIIREDEFFALMQAAITGYSSPYTNDRTPTQLVTGVGSGGLSKANLANGATLEYYWLNESPRMAYLRQLDLYSTSLLSSSATGGTASDATAELKGALTAVTTLGQATDLIQGAVSAKLAKAMTTAVEEIDVQRPVSSYGVDSLVAAEMRNWCFRELKADVSVFELLSGNSIAVLSGLVAARSTLVPDGVRVENS